MHKPLEIGRNLTSQGAYMSNTTIYFATFGSSQLTAFNINPITTAVFIPNQPEYKLREVLQKPPFDNKYCTTYPMSAFPDMKDKYNMKLLTLDELMTYKI